MMIIEIDGKVATEVDMAQIKEGNCTLCFGRYDPGWAIMWVRTSGGTVLWWHQRQTGCPQ